MSVYLGKNKVELVGGTTTMTTSGGIDTSDATALSSDLLYGKTAYVKGKKITGSMADHGTINKEISSKDDFFYIPKGYHNGNGIIEISSSERQKLIPSNIKQGVTLLGVIGTLSPSGVETDMKPQEKTIIPSNFDQIVYPDDGYNCLSQVVVKKIPYSEANNMAGGITVTIG